jgi:hypothetical protein
MHVLLLFMEAPTLPAHGISESFPGTALQNFKRMAGPQVSARDYLASGGVFRDRDLSIPLKFEALRLGSAVQELQRNNIYRKTVSR